MSDVVQSLRQALQDVVAPELREHWLLLIALDSKIDSRTAELRSELAAMGSDLRASKKDKRQTEDIIGRSCAGHSAVHDDELRY
jgi:hypothetical protein